MRSSTGNDTKAWGWGCATYVAIISIILAVAWFRMYVR